MNEEEKKAIRSMKRFIECKQDMTAVTASEMKTVLNLLERKDKQLEERTNRIKNLEKECQNCFDAMMDTINENNFKNEIIVEMAKLIFNHRCDFEWYEVGIDIDDIKQQIEYFKNEVKRRMENE